MKIVIPSYSRASKVSATKLVRNPILCVPKGQKKEYQKHNDCEIVVHDDEMKGLSPKKDWIYRKFGDVFMLDDDATAFQRLYREKNVKLTVDEATDLIDDTYELCKEYGIKIFSFNCYKRPLLYSGDRPIKLTGFFQNAACGMLKDDKLFYPDIPDFYGTDVFIAALNGHFHRYCWIDNRFTVMFKDTMTGEGGCSEYRMKGLKDTLLYLKKCFGDSIIQESPRYSNGVFVKYEKKFKSPY